MERRAFLGMGLTGAAGVAVGASGALALDRVRALQADGAVGRATVPFHGAHQPGVETPLQAHGTLMAFRLLPTTDRVRLERLLRLWSGDAALLQAGEPALADANPELARTPASLSITIGLGWGAFERAGLQERWPAPERELPGYPIDRLDPRWSGGDLLLQVCANDGVTVSHALRELIRDAQPFAVPMWQQSGWMPQPDVNPGATARTLMGFKDGTANPVSGTQVFEQAVWNDGAEQPWFSGGTTMVIRRIRIDMDVWDTVPPALQEAAFGRHMTTGAPLGGTSEFEVPDLERRDGTGALVIPADAHMRRARLQGKILRRPFNYDDGLDAQGRPDLGLIFIAFGARLEQYLEIQASLAASDALNTWTVPVGSGLFVVPPGANAPDGWVGETLFA